MGGLLRRQNAERARQGLPAIPKPAEGSKRATSTPLKQAGQKKGAAPGNLGKKVKPRQGLNQRQERGLRQQERADVQLGAQANALLPRVEEAYSQPFDFSSLPSAPVTGDFNAWKQQQTDDAYNLFKSRQEPQFEQQRQDLEQQLYNRGIPVGSELYNNQMQQLQRQQEDARQSALVNAQGIAGQNAGQFFDIGQQARGSALSEGLLGRNMPLSEFSALYGAQSGLGAQNAAYNQQLGAQQQAADLQLRNAQQAPRGGGGGGEVWQQYGFSSPIEYDAYRTQQQQAAQLWAFQNDPRYRQPSSPSYGAQIGGQILGGLSQGFGSYLGGLFK